MIDGSKSMSRGIICAISNSPPKKTWKRETIMKNQIDINDASKLALMRVYLKLIADTARARDEVTLVREELHALAATYPTRYENVRRLTATELHACVEFLDEASDLCAKDTSLGAATVAQMLRDDVAGHYRRLWSEAQHLEGDHALYLPNCEICEKEILHHSDICDECFIEVMELDDEDDEIAEARKEPLVICDKCVEIKFNEIKESSSIYVAESIIHRLVAKYPKWLKPKIVDVRIVQTQERVWLEITTEYEQNFGSLLDRTIKQSDLGFCFDGEPDVPYFSPDDSVSYNATKFVETWDPYSIIMTTKLFHREARVQIDSDKDLNPRWEPF